jgi:hypothetical protein
VQVLDPLICLYETKQRIQFNEDDEIVDLPQMFCNTEDSSISKIQRARYAYAWSIENVGVNHGGGDVGMAQQFLYGANVMAGFEQVGGETVSLMFLET